LVVFCVPFVAVSWFLICVNALAELRQTIARLRAPDGCPWDIEQTHESLVRCLIDEVSELIETIDHADWPHMREELGDVLIQVFFHAQIAEESGHFDLDDVAREVNEKLIRRHPHVFGDGAAQDSGEVLKLWEQIKAQERKDAGKTERRVFKELPPRLPALMYAEAVWKQMRKQALPATPLIDAERVARLAEPLTDEALGQALFKLTAAARARGLDPEGALRRTSDRVMHDVEQRLQTNTPA